MTSGQADAVKQQVAAHWDRRASHFDEDFGHSIRTAAERAAWDRILDLVLAGRGPSTRSMPAAAPAFSASSWRPGAIASPAWTSRPRWSPRRGARRRRAAWRSGSRRPTPSSSRLRPAASTSSSAATCSGRSRTRRRRSTSGSGSSGRAGAWSSSTGSSTPAPWRGAAGGARASNEYAAIGDQLPFLGGRPREEIEALLIAHGLVDVKSDPLLDLVAAQEQRMVAEGLERRTHRRYVAWGDVRGQAMDAEPRARRRGARSTSSRSCARARWPCSGPPIAPRRAA